MKRLTTILILIVLAATMQGCTGSPEALEIVGMGRPVRPGDIEVLTVLGVDSKGWTKPVTADWALEGGCAVLLGSIGHAAYVAAIEPGTYRVTASKGDLADKADFDVYSPVTSRIVCINDYPGKRLEMLVGDTEEVPAYGFDQYGREMDVELEWSVTGELGELTELEDLGIYGRASFRATKGGTGWITASEGEASDSVLVIIWPYEQIPTSIIVEPVSQIAYMELLYSFGAGIFDQFGRLITDYEGLSWELAGDIGSIRSHGSNCLFEPKKVGTGTLIARAGDLTASATITVVE